MNKHMLTVLTIKPKYVFEPSQNPTVCNECGKIFDRMVGWPGRNCGECIEKFNDFIEKRKKELGLKSKGN